MLSRLAQFRLSRSALAVAFLLTCLLIACAIPQRPGSNPPPPPSSTPGAGPASCSIGQDWCQGRCVETSDYLNDSQNCGRCGNSCSMNQSCNGGSCSCSLGFEQCMGRCVNSASFMSDPQNCGRCGNFCGAGESCLGGSCRKL